MNSSAPSTLAPAIIALINFEKQLPLLKMDQAASIDLIGSAHQQAENAPGDSLIPLMKRYGVKPSQIATRYFENIALGAAGEDILARTQFFAQRGKQVVADFYSSKESSFASPLQSVKKSVPDHLIHVTCTGYVSPSPVQHLVNDQGWAGKTGVTHAYHMGCYASLPAVRMAEGLVAARNKQVDIIHTEMCGLHMDRTTHSPEQLVVQSLFADGHIKYSAVPATSLDARKTEVQSIGYKVLAIDELIVPNSQQDMSWITASWGMKMTLSRDVPTKIEGSLRGFVMNLCKNAGVDFSKILKEGVFAIHPGGPKIIDVVQSHLELRDDQVQASRHILLTRGNMSSATLPHVWSQILEENIAPGKKVLSLAFGPGLTIFGALFESV